MLTASPMLRRLRTGTVSGGGVEPTVDPHAAASDVPPAEAARLHLPADVLRARPETAARAAAEREARADTFRRHLDRLRERAEPPNEDAPARACDPPAGRVLPSTAAPESARGRVAGDQANGTAGAPNLSPEGAA